MAETTPPTTPRDNRPEDRTRTVLPHVTTYLGYAIPFGQFLGPYTIQLLRGSESEVVLAHTREVLNFQLTILGLVVAGFVLLSTGIGWIVIAAALAQSMVQTVRGARAASRSETFEYPFTLRLLASSPRRLTMGGS